MVSVWATSKFGLDARAVAALVTEGLHVAHERAAAAHDAGGLSTADAYGSTLWLAAPEEILARIEEIEGSVRIKPARSRYTLGVVQDQVIFPMRIGSDLRTPPTEVRVQMSGVKSDLFRLGPQPTQVGMTGSLYTEDLTPEPTMPAADADPHEFDRHNLIVIAYVSSPDGGLAAAWWGEAALKRDGHLDWHYIEPLDLTRTAEPAGRLDLQLIRGGTAVVQSFKDAPLEETSLGLRSLLEVSPETESTKEPRVPEAPTGSSSDE